MKQFLITIDDTNDFTPAQLYAELEACLAFEFDNYPSPSSTTPLRPNLV